MKLLLSLILAACSTNAYAIGNSLGDPVTRQASSVSDGAITSAKLDEPAVNTEHLYDGAATSDKIDTSAVTTGKIATDGVTSPKILANSVVLRHMSDASVDTEELVDLSVSSDKIQVSAIGTTKLADDAVTSTKILNDSITTSKLASSFDSLDRVSGGVMWASDNGNIGIGTNSPAYALDVSGTGKFSDTLYVDTDIIGSTDGMFLRPASGSLSLNKTSVANVFDLYKVNVLNSRISTSGKSYLNGGDLGIGTTATTSAKVTVAGATADYILMLKDDSENYVFGFEDISHFEVAGSAVSVSDCGAGAAVGTNANDTAGHIDINNAGVSDCTVTFADTWDTLPKCMCNSTAGECHISEKTVSSMKLSASGNFTNGSDAEWICIGVHAQ